MTAPSFLPPHRRPDPRRLEIARYPFSVVIPTRWGDQDVQRHLNNVAIAELYQEGRTAFLRGPGRQDDFDFGVVLGAVYLDYVAEGRYPEPVTIGVGVADLGRSSLRLAQVMMQGDICLGVAESVQVCVNDQMRSMPLSEEYRAVLESLLVTAD